MMKNILAAIYCCIALLSTASDNTYHYSFDLSAINADKLQVTLITPTITENEVVFSMPRIIPGTYSIYDFGRFADNVQAFDKNGIGLPVSRIDTNQWKISNAQNMVRLTYWLNDTYDDNGANPIFEPAGTDFQTDSVFVLNWHTMLGYFNGHVRQPYEITVKHRPDFYGSTALTDRDNAAATDVFTAANYNEIIDNPVMYALPDTAHITVGTTDVLIGLYSPSHKANARALAQQLDTLLQAQGKYLGGKLPVEKYAFLLLLTNKPGRTGGLGALEHSYCSMYFLMDGDNQTLAPMLRDVAAHEFFHIVTPLNIHSRQIEFFDFDHPEMSEHLWLYEGSTEYHAHMVQVKYNLISKEDFLNVIKQKMDEAQFQFNDTLPFTVMSKGCLDEYKDQYNNVYAKGALISMCMDLELLHQSNGKYGIMNLIRDLSKEYGKSQFFEDQDLFAKIVSLTSPEMKTFTYNYIAGSQPLPFQRDLAYAGVKYEKMVTSKGYSMGQFGVGYNPVNNKLIVTETKNMNDFGQKVGYRDGDVLLKFNGKKIVPMKFQEMRSNWMAAAKDGDKFTMLVARAGADGKIKKVKLTATVFRALIKRYNVISFDSKATPEQLAIREAWLK